MPDNVVVALHRIQKGDLVHGFGLQINNPESLSFETLGSQ